MIGLIGAVTILGVAIGSYFLFFRSGDTPSILAEAKNKGSERDPSPSPVPKKASPSPVVSPTALPVEKPPVKKLPEEKRPEEKPPAKKTPEEKPPIEPVLTEANATLTPEDLSRVKVATVLVKVIDSERGTATGSGVFVVQPGVVLTNAHVLGMEEPDVTAPKVLQVIVRSGEATEEAFDAKVAGVDRDNDLAVLHIAPGEAKKGALPAPLTLYPAKSLRETQKLFALGFPFGEALGKQVTINETSVSSLRRDALDLLDRIQVNGGLHPGNSGGPLVDGSARVIGIAVSGIKGTGIQFAIPSEKAMDFFAGRVNDVALGKAVQVEKSLSLPVALEFVDPLGKLKDIELEWWWGGAGGPRMASAKMPDPVAGDLPIASVPVTLAVGKNVGTAELKTEGPPAGKFLWCRPVLKNGMKTRWERAWCFPVDGALSFDPLKIAKVAHDDVPLTLHVHSRLKHLAGPFAAKLISSSSTFDLLELNPKKTDDNGRFFVLRGVRVAQAVDGKDKLLLNDWERLIAQINHSIVVGHSDEQGSYVSTSLKKSYAAGKNKILDQVLDRAAQYLEILSVPIPAGSIDPAQSWRASRPIPADPLDDSPLEGVLDIELKYLGTRNVILNKIPKFIPGTITSGGPRKVNVGIITFSGSVEAKPDRTRQPQGKVEGVAWVDCATGRVHRIGLKMEVKHRRVVPAGFELEALETTELSLVRDKVTALPSAILPLELTGAWCLTKKTMHGKVQTLGGGAESWWVFHHDKLEFTDNNGKLESRTIPIVWRPELFPGALDLAWGEGVGPLGKWIPAALEMKGKTLKVVMNFVKTERPIGFRAVSEPGNTLFEFERVEGYAPGFRRTAKAPKIDIATAKKVLTVDPLIATSPPRMWETSLARVHQFIPGNKAVYKVAISSDGKRVAAVRDDRLHLFDVDNKKALRDPIPLNGQVVKHLSISGDGRRVFTGDGKDNGFIWDADTGIQLHHTSFFLETGLSFSPHGRYRAHSFYGSGSVHIADPLSENDFFLLPLRGGFKSLISPNGTHLLVHTQEKLIVFDFATMVSVREFVLPPKSQGVPQWSRDSKKVLFFLMDKTTSQTLIAWEMDSGREVFRHLVEDFDVHVLNDYVIIGRKHGTDVCHFDKLNVIHHLKNIHPNFDASANGRIVDIWLNLAVAKNDPLLTGETPKVARKDDPKVGAETDSWDPSVLKAGDAAKGLDFAHLICSDVKGLTRYHSALSPDGKTAAAFVRGNLHFFFLDTSKSLVTPIAENVVPSENISFSADSRFVLLHAQKHLLLFDAPSGKLAKSWVATEQTVHSSAVSPTGRFVVSLDSEKVLKTWESATGRLLQTQTSLQLGRLHFAPNGKVLLFSNQRRILVLELASLRTIRQFVLPGDCNEPTLSLDGKILLTFTSAGTHAWDLESGDKLFERPDLSSVGGITINQLSMVGPYLLHFRGSILNVYLPDQKKPLLTQKGVPFLKVAPIGRALQINSPKLILHAPPDDPLILASTKGPPPAMLKEKYRIPIAGHAQFQELDDLVVIRSQFGDTMTFWDVKANKLVFEHVLKDRAFGPAFLSPDRRRLWFSTVPPIKGGAPPGFVKGTINVLDVSGGKLATLPGHLDHIIEIFPLGDKKTFISCSLDQSVKLWDLKSGKNITTFGKLSAWISYFRVSPDGKTALFRVAAKPYPAILVDLKTGRELRSIEPIPEFTPPRLTKIGAKVVAYSERRLVTWDVATGAVASRDPIPAFPDQEESSLVHAISRYGDMLYLGSPNRNLLIAWNIAQKKEMTRYTLPIPISEFFSVSADNRTLIMRAEKGTAVFDLADSPK